MEAHFDEVRPPSSHQHASRHSHSPPPSPSSSSSSSPGRGGASPPTRTHVVVTWRLCRGGGPVEVSYGITALDTRVGKEVFVSFQSDIGGDDDESDADSQTTFFTDSNGRRMVRRVRVGDPWTNLTDVPRNYYPATSSAYLEDADRRLSLFFDRAVGVASMRAGQLEAMVYRWTNFDDGRGLGEPGREVNARGLLRDSTRGRLWMTVGDCGDASQVESLTRQVEEQLRFPPVAAVAAMPPRLAAWQQQQQRVPVGMQQQQQQQGVPVGMQQQQQQQGTPLPPSSPPAGRRGSLPSPAALHADVRLLTFAVAP
eukprot:GHVU01032919.1.p1 GENE.GHVU01032919.1~~GHVU01032919.1.p1  ORF type:complete len:335 (-),score=94.37 GHVU01032919.1:24-959(-)